MNNDKKGVLQNRWSSDEKRILLNLCSKYPMIAFTVSPKSIKSDKRKVLWKNIHTDFLNICKTERTCRDLQVKWMRIKAYSRYKISLYHKYLANPNGKKRHWKPSNFDYDVNNVVEHAKASQRAGHSDESDVPIHKGIVERQTNSIPNNSTYRISVINLTSIFYKAHTIVILNLLKTLENEIKYSSNASLQDTLIDKINQLRHLFNWLYFTNLTNIHSSPFL